MRIDAHQHFWKYNSQEYGWIDDSMALLRRDFLPHDLEPELARNQFQGCVAVQARQSLEETRWLLDLANTSSFILGVVGWVDLCSDDVKRQLQNFARDPKLVGIRHLVQSEPDDRFLLRPDFLRGIAVLEEFDLAYDILIYPKHLPVVLDFVRRFPRQRFVLDHLAKPEIKSRSMDRWAHGIRGLAAFPNVFCKLSGLVTEADCGSWTPRQLNPYLDVACEAFGAERIMIGSDWPVCLVAGSYSRVMQIVEEYVMHNFPNKKEVITGGNAQEFWKLNSPRK